jgi:23S rRNA pseudouridine1911/1915/1917 synthase
MAVMASLIFADDRLLAVAKPAGLSLATRRAEPSAAVARLLAALPAAEVQELGLAPETVWLVHRLDVGTSGLVLLARSREAHVELAQAFVERRVDKRYLALLWGHPRPREGSWNAPLGPDRRDRRRMLVAEDGSSAESQYRIVATAPHLSLVELHPLTGRTHQLRVHAAHAGHPIVGDDLYGGPRHRGVQDPALRQVLQPGRPLLHAWRLTLPASRGHGELRLEAPLPADFAGAIAALGMPVDTILEQAQWPAAGFPGQTGRR